MNILFIVPYTPTFIRVRPYNLIRFLARRGHKVTVATLWETPAERETLKDWQSQGVGIVAAPLTRGRKAWNSIRALPTRVPVQAAFCRSPELEQAIGATLNQHRSQTTARNQRFDVVHVEHLRGAHYGLYLRGLYAAHPISPPIVWDSVDCISHLFEQAARYGWSLFSRLTTRLELGRTRRYEGWLVSQFDRVLVTSDSDRAALERLQPQGNTSRITVLPNGVDLEHFTPDERERKDDTVVFSGKMSYHANASAALFLANQVMPWVWAKHPDVRLVIAGSRPPSAIRRLAGKSPGQIEVTGYVSDMRRPLQQATVAAAPLLYGAGIQNKVLEAMACGTPVVASRRAVSALGVQPGRDCLVADTPEEFAGGILRLFDDAASRRAIGAEGRRYVEKHHDWDAIAMQLESIYQDVISERAATEKAHAG